MSVDFTPEELRRESDAELQRRMNLYRPESGAYKAAAAEWDRRRNAPKVRREQVLLFLKAAGVFIGLPGAIAAFLVLLQRCTSG